MTNLFDPAPAPSEPVDFLAGMHLTVDERRQADELAQGALRVASDGGDVEAWVREWADRQEQGGRTSKTLSKKPQER